MYDRKGGDSVWPDSSHTGSSGPERPVYGRRVTRLPEMFVSG
jgi:hypothetical protein